MSGYSNMGENNFYYGPQNPAGMYPQIDDPFYVPTPQQLDFQTFGDQPMDQFQDNFLQSQYAEKLTPGDNCMSSAPIEPDFDEPPLLEELEIYPDRIMEKVFAVLNPFRCHSLADDADFLTKDSDLAGPLAFCLTLAVCLFVSGSRAQFGYIYGLSVVSCLLMYCLLNLMSSTDRSITLGSIASVLGYALLPIVGLSVLGLITSFQGPTGIVMCVVSVIWSSLASSRLFVAMSGETEQRSLVAYPCVLVYGVFALLIVF